AITGRKLPATVERGRPATDTGALCKMLGFYHSGNLFAAGAEFALRRVTFRSIIPRPRQSHASRVNRLKISRRLVQVVAAMAALTLPVSLFAGDTLLIHGHIYTGNAKAPWAQALAITGTRIESVGADQEILSRRRANTEVIDLHGRTVIPGISD